MLAAAVPFYPAAQDDAVVSITAALRARRFQQALDQARAARRASPKEVRILVLEGMALTGLRKDADALTVLKTAMEMAPDYVPALEAAVEIEYRQGKPEATAHLQRLLVLHPGEPTAHAMLGALAWKHSDCGSAVQHFGQAGAAIAAQPDALREFGACLVKMKRPEEAAGVFRQLMAVRPDDRRARYSLAVALMDAARFRDAIAALEPLTGASHPDPHPDPIALELTSTAHEALGETPQAVAVLRQAVLLDPRNVNLYLDFASLSFTHQSFEVGIDMIDAGLTQIPDSGALYLARGVLYVQLAEYAKADADFDQAERLNPDRALGSAARGLSQIQQNNLDQALVTVRSQLKVTPNDEFLHYVLAELLSRQGAQPGSPEFQQALDAAREAVRLKPDFVLARDVLSRLYLQAGEVEPAIEQCRLVLRDNPSDEMALYRLIRALQSSGRPDVPAEVPALLKRFTALRNEARRREAQESQYRLVEDKPAGAGK
ncbi:MAG TPA: tetratricopeptide repeat protein [Candidatus Acidoferrales bacterium]|nr:tetratricopeptide repeat protein [Candidatus Acidoferrales bacterium]